MTPRQLEVVTELVRHGSSNKIIAYKLGMAESTVKVHVRNIMKQLGAQNRLQIVLRMAMRSTPAARRSVDCW